MVFFKSSSFFAVASIALSLVLAQQPAPTCFSLTGGTSGAGNCSQFITQMCDSTASTALTTTSLKSRDRASRCFNLVDGLGRRCELTIANVKTPDAGTVPSNANCRNGLTNVASHCDFGGRSTVTGDATFLYYLDIKNGGCDSVNLVH
ncbi:hypothetical protein BDZ89DRAFT_1061434 [Hymenopellis radicata]|nr:hypothetical protein BDZ89DRAFT_1061434 [Hymenopellis radicata]